MFTYSKKKQLKQKFNKKISLSWGFSKLNYLVFTIGLISILFGYLIMAAGEVNSFQSLTLAPLMLFFGYIFFIPAALIYRAKENNKKNK